MNITIITLILSLVMLTACNALTPAPAMEPSSSVESIPRVPLTSASAITSPPPSMVGINTHTDMYGTGADPDIITLGPKFGGQPDWKPYANKTSMEF